MTIPMPLALTFYGVVLSVHIMAVVVAFGALFAYPVVLPWARSAHPEALPILHAATSRLLKVVVQPAMVLVLLCGIYLASDADVWSESWVSVPLVILLVVGGILGAFSAPKERELAQLVAGGDEPSAAYDDLARRVVIAAYANCALVLIAIFFMTARPGA
ncbi:hypothetical protein DSM104299_05383 [Baekduia alba]|uniref:DUF2269 family protein n=1 Tax=Baekduia alba TaxID=2997333 RepID=UPI0023413C23|nr:DUF2269 family protein [Baekduia alba]WCB96618.1 hypothetical protein DSM104299_05383 [Baekduia alba]